MGAPSPGIAAAFVGLCFWYAFAKTALLLPIGALGRFLKPLFLPVALAAVVRLAFGLGWWVVAAVPLAIACVGLLHGIAVRAIRPARIYAAQPVWGIAGLLAIALSWSLQFR